MSAYVVMICYQWGWEAVISANVLKSNKRDNHLRPAYGINFSSRFYFVLRCGKALTTHSNIFVVLYGADTRSYQVKIEKMSASADVQCYQWLWGAVKNANIVW